MLQRLLPAFLAVSVLASVGTAGTPDWKDKYLELDFVAGFEEGQEAVRRTGKPPMYFFSAKWCGACKDLVSSEFQEDEVRKALAYVTPILVDGDHDKEALRRFRIDRFPTVIFADARGDVVKAYRGLSAASQLDRDARGLSIRMTFSRLDEAMVREAPRRALDAVADLEELGLRGRQARRLRRLSEVVLERGDEQVEEARQCRRPGEARKRLESLVTQFAGTRVAKAAREALASR